ncbi:MAG: hypothetical protein AB1505_14985 [Candidatus Latescibacterota bacterium]
MGHRHLFLDMREVTRVERLHRHLHPARRHPANPILRCEHPWEDRVSLYGTVLDDPEAGILRMYYLTGPARPGFVQVRGRRALGNITLLGYAESRDGIQWQKPILGQLDYEGSCRNNLIDVGRTNCEGFAALWDPHDPDPQRRYKGFYWEHGGIDTFAEWKDGRLIWGEGEGDGMWMSFSADGVHWQDCGANPVIRLGSDTTQSLVWDPGRRKYAVYGRFGAGGRRVGRAESDDALHFSEPQLVLAPDALDEEGTQFYGMPLDLYEGLYVGMLWVYREGVDGTIDTGLAVSRDGIVWERVLDRQTFLPLGEEGSWEDGMARIGQRIIVRGDELYLYYGGVQGPHTGRKFAQVERRHRPMLGLATLRRDGFVSVRAGTEEGMLLTRPANLEGERLHVNAASAGYLIVEVTDEEGRALPGWVSQPLTADCPDAAVPFGRPLAELGGRPVRLRFRLRQADLYSWWCGA